jgi:hypothetical protein
MKFVLHRTRTIASTMGISIAFEKGVPHEVPPFMYPEVIAAGGVPESELTDEEATGKTGTEPADADERKIALFDLFEKLVLRNVREEFTAGGAPHASVLLKELGWSVAAKERDAAWAEFKAGSD